jgi:hypothetical protein
MHATRVPSAAPRARRRTRADARTAGACVARPPAAARAQMQYQQEPVYTSAPAPQLAFSPQGGMGMPLPMQGHMHGASWRTPWTDCCAVPVRRRRRAHAQRGSPLLLPLTRVFVNCLFTRFARRAAAAAAAT